MEIPEIPETRAQIRNRKAREKYRDNEENRNAAKKKAKERHIQGLKKKPTPEEEKINREARKLDPVKYQRFQSQKKESARRKAAAKKARKEEEKARKEEELMQDFAETFLQPEPEPEHQYQPNEYQYQYQPNELQSNELQDLDQAMDELIGSGPIFTRPRRITPEAIPIPTAQRISPQQEEWGRGMLNVILNSLTEEQRASPHLREIVRNWMEANLINIREYPHIIQLVLNFFDEMVLQGNGRPKLQAYKVQSVLFDKRVFNPQQAMMWIQQNGYKVKKVDETGKKYRFRQVAPATLRKKNYSKFITKKLGNSGIELIIAYPISYA